MELDDLKHNWNIVSNELTGTQILNTEKINKMTQATFTHRLKKITYPEIAGAIICLACSVFFVFNFEKFDTVFSKIAGILSITLLLILSLISLKSIRLFNIKNFNKTYAETLADFMIKKIKFFKLQRINIFLCHLLLVGIIIVLPKFFGDKQLSGNINFWMFSFSAGYIFLLFYSGWVFKSYNKILRHTENLLKEIPVDKSEV